MEGNTLEKGIDLSIIIPLYNTPLVYLKECLESIVKANLRYTFEIIIVNDGSTNQEITDFLKEYKNPHTTIIHKENTGVSDSRNIGMERSRGQFVICLDSDDKILPAINEALDYLRENKEYSALFCDVQFFGDSDYYYKKGEFSKFQLLYISNMLTPSSTLFRREIAAAVQFNKDLSYSEDKDFFYRAVHKGFQFKYFPKTFCFYRKIYNNQSLSQKNIAMRDEVENFIKSQFNPHHEITIDDVNQYILHNFRGHKKHLIKMCIILFSPRLFKFLLSKKNL